MNLEWVLINVYDLWKIHEKMVSDHQEKLGAIRPLKPISGNVTKRGHSCWFGSCNPRTMDWSQCTFLSCRLLKSSHTIAWDHLWLSLVGGHTNASENRKLWLGLLCWTTQVHPLETTQPQAPACGCMLSHIWLCNPMDCSPPGSSVHGILQARYWSGLSCPPPGDLPDPGIELSSPMSPTLQVNSSPTAPSRKPSYLH